MITKDHEYRVINSQFVFVTVGGDVENPITKLPGTSNGQSVSSDVSILYDKDAGILISHGPHETVAQLHRRLAAGLGRSLVLATSKGWDIAELNKIISIPGYVKQFHTTYYAPPGGSA